MRRRKSLEALKYLSVGAVAAAVAAFLFLHNKAGRDTLPPALAKQQAAQPAGKKTTGYKEEDRRKLEQLIHEGSKDD